MGVCTVPRHLRIRDADAELATLQASGVTDKE